MPYVRLTASLMLLGACAPTTSGIVVVGDGLSELPPVAVTVVTPGEWMDVPPERPDGTSAQTQGWLPLALGADYPTAIDLVPGEIWESRCLWEGEFIAGAVRSLDTSVIDATLRGDTVKLDVRGAGTTEVILEGRFEGGCSWETSPPGPFELTRRYEIIVAEPDGAVLELPFGCDAPLLTSDAALSPGFSVIPTFKGEPREVVNARPGRQVRVFVGAEDGMSAAVSLPDSGISDLQIEGTGTVVLSTVHGPFAELEVVAPSDITDMSLEWIVPMGDFGRDKPLIDGETYAWSEMYELDTRMAVVRTSAPQIGDRTACTVPNPDWFDLDVSVAHELIGDDFEDPMFATRFGLGAHLLEVGRTRLNATAPELNRGEGIDAKVEVVFTE